MRSTFFDDFIYHRGRIPDNVKALQLIHCCRRYEAAVEDLWAVTPVYIFTVVEARCDVRHFVLCTRFLNLLLPECDYVTFGYLPSQFRLSVTFVHPTQPVEIFDNISTLLCSLSIR